VVVARDEEPRLGAVLDRLPATACGLAVDVLVVDDGSADGTARVARERGAKVISHERSLGLGAGLRSGLEHARDAGYDAAVYLDGDGEYDAAELPRVLEPVARGRADYACGSRFLGSREGMAWHRALANRAVSAVVGALVGGAVITDAQSGYRAFSARALAHARIAHDYNYAQVLTLSLWGAGIDLVEIPISYRRRAGGRSFVRYPEYLARVAPAVWRQWRTSKKARTSSAHPIPVATANGQALWPNEGNSVVSGPNGASGRGPTSPPSPTRTSR
jgi:glycosyltransferase involved in cell wall biosynthesis